MSSSAILISISQWLVIIVGLSFLFFGLIGTLANLLIFSNRRLRKLPSTQYILIQSIFNILIFSFALLAQILVTGFVWPYFFAFRLVCISRNYIGIFSTQSYLYLKCLVAFDAWASTSESVSIRQWSTVRRARLLILINIMFWSLLSIPYAIWNNNILQKNIWQCSLVGEIFQKYHGYFFVPTLVLFIPLLWLSFFGYHTYKHITRFKRCIRRLVRLKQQFTPMILAQVFVLIISFVPYTVQYTYTTITANWQKDSQWLAIDSIIVLTGRMCFFFNNAVEFYIYIYLSSEIRSIFKQLIFKLIPIRLRNVVLPI
ncbi:unnamed protein product [Adineta ricciae]|uniref:G-protein coupled receptors family 1 profile domain-containing protein n=1 Tax=Adineta ricciae TaxID=249248 RepID=A0A815HVP1_ADIRI|nr:unnamed protein product [Adineta ricciae]CAF1357634.1 unnamed protein product [Adineta ricciae]